MPDNKTTEVTHEITFSGQIVHGPEARDLAKKIFAEQLRRYQECGVGQGIDILAITKGGNHLVDAVKKIAENKLNNLDTTPKVTEGEQGEVHVDTFAPGRGLTTPQFLLDVPEPPPFILRDGTEVSGGVFSPLVVRSSPKGKYRLRRRELYSRTVKVISRVKRGPGKGRIRRVTKQYWREYYAYYGIH